MNITPAFRSTLEWKKFKRAIAHDAAMELYVNICCEVELITSKAKIDKAMLGTNNPDDVALLCGSDDFSIDPTHLVDSLLSSGLMTKEDEGFRLVAWEGENSKLIANRINGRKGGRPIKTQPNTIEQQDNPSKGNSIQSNTTQHKGPETQSKPMVNPSITDGSLSHEETQRAFDELDDENSPF